MIQSPNLHARVKFHSTVQILVCVTQTDHPNQLKYLLLSATDDQLRTAFYQYYDQRQLSVMDHFLLLHRNYRMSCQAKSKHYGLLKGQQKIFYEQFLAIYRRLSLSQFLIIRYYCLSQSESSVPTVFSIYLLYFNNGYLKVWITRNYGYLKVDFQSRTEISVCFTTAYLKVQFFKFK